MGTNRDPLRVVETAQWNRRNVIMNNALTVSWWELGLECGHIAERRVRFPKQEGHSRRGFAILHHPRLPNEALPPPRRVRCEDCAQGRPAWTLERRFHLPRATVVAGLEVGRG